MCVRVYLWLSVFVMLVLSISKSAAGGAEDVTLTLRGGGLTVIGELIASDKNSFVIKTSKFGVMSLDATKFDCAGSICPKMATKIGIHGSNTIGAQLMPATIERFAEQESYTVEKVVGSDAEEVQYRLSTADGKDLAIIDLQSHGSNTAVPSLHEGSAQIGAMSRPIKPEEVKQLTDINFKPQTNVFALDGVLVLVSPQNPIKALSLDQISKIFAGEIKDWSQLGGNPGPITIYARDGKSGTYDTFDNLVLKPRNLKLAPAAKRFESSPDLSDEVARDAGGIGFVGFAYLRNAKALSIASTCGITSAPDMFSVKTEEYPLSRRLYLYTSAALADFPKKLMDYAMSDQAQDMVADEGFISQKIEIQPFDAQTGRLAPALMVADKDFNLAQMRELITILKDARRLSIHFHFQKQSAALDEKSMQDLPRLFRFLKANESQIKHVVLVGFSDNGGTFDANRTLSLSRANSVKVALVAEGFPATQISVHAYGSLLPVACNTTDAGKETNRRVEVWIKE